MSTEAPIPADAGSKPEEHCSSPGLLLAILGHLAMRRLREAHLRHALSPRQFHLLSLLHGHGPTGQRELGLAMDTDPSILVTLLNPLERDGLISRRRDSDDRRRHLVTLTTKGERRLTAAARAQREAEDELLAGLDDRQREQLRALLLLVQGGVAHESLARACDSEDECS